MLKTEKEQLYDFLRLASASIYGFASKEFLLEKPNFFDDADFSQQDFSSSAQIVESFKTENHSPASFASETTTVSDSFSSLAQKIASCKRCQLASSRHNTVPGTGCTTPLVLVIGEGPGYEEDIQALPFVGPAGQLLDKMLAAINLSRNTNTYIANIVKCRPPQNRVPYPEEADACLSFLQAQITLLKPKMILCVGSTAAKNLLKTELGVTKLRGSFYDYAGIPVCVTYHPSALLRDENLKRPAWEDLKMFKAKLLELVPDYQKSFRG